MRKSKHTVAILLPYKEIYSTKFSGAASIWVNDYLSLSNLKKDQQKFNLVFIDADKENYKNL